MFKKAATEFEAMTAANNAEGSQSSQFDAINAGVSLTAGRIGSDAGPGSSSSNQQIQNGELSRNDASGNAREATTQGGAGSQFSGSLSASAGLASKDISAEGSSCSAASSTASINNTNEGVRIANQTTKDTSFDQVDSYLRNLK